MPNINRIMKAKQERKAEKQKKYAASVELSEFWQELRVQALERGDKDCPICYYRLNLKDVVLLDCTHLFHQACLDSFERFDTKPMLD
jgi:hypothetical protein